MPATAGSSIRWTAPPISCTASPHWSISIAVEREGEVIAGLVYNPVTDEMFWAEKGPGAPISTTGGSGSRPGGAWRRAVLGTGAPFLGHGDTDTFQAELSALMPTIAGVRRFGSAALDLSFVAAGRFDGFWETGLNAWDVAAGIILVREAGGYVHRDRRRPQSAAWRAACWPPTPTCMCRSARCCAALAKGWPRPPPPDPAGQPVDRPVRPYRHTYGRESRRYSCAFQLQFGCRP